MAATITNAYRVLLRPLLFRLPPEVAQKAADFALRRQLVWRSLTHVFRVRDARLNVNFCGLTLKNPIGLAAGYDKNCALLPSLASLGFGYITCGTVTESAQPGNPRPRMFRLTKEESLINALGFPNKGLESAANQLEWARRALVDTPVVASVSGVSTDEMLRCHRRLEPLANAVELNISSPNTAGLRVFHAPPALSELIGRINEGRNKPLLVKLPPYSSPSEAGPADDRTRERLVALARVCLDMGVDAVTVANSRPITDSRLATGVGGLSGRVIFPDTLMMVRDVREEVGDKLAISACGGVSSGEDAWEALKAGATTVQLFTALIYRGPGVTRQINHEMLAAMEREGVDSLRTAPSKA